MRSFIYTLEVLISIAAISVLLIHAFSEPWHREEKRELLISIGSSAIDYAYESGLLRANYQNEAALKAKLRELLPASLDFEVRVCESECGIKANESVVVVERFLAGNDTSFYPRVIRLFLWER